MKSARPGCENPPLQDLNIMAVRISNTRQRLWLSLCVQMLASPPKVEGFILQVLQGLGILQTNNLSPTCTGPRGGRGVASSVLKGGNLKGTRG